MIDVMMIVPLLPYPVMDGDSVRHYNMIKRLAGKCRITLVCYGDENNIKSGIPEMQNFCQDVVVIPITRRPKSEWCVRFTRSYIQGAPTSAAVHYSPSMRAEIISLLQKHQYDIVQIEHTFMAQYIHEVLKYSKAHTLLTVHNIEQILTRRQYQHMPCGHLKLRYMLDTAVLGRFERWAMKRFDRCITVSETNAELIRPVRSDVITIENGVDVTAITPVPANPDSKEMVFIGGMNYGPNIDGSIFMAKDILPLILQKIPQAHLNIVGRQPDKAVRELGEQNEITVAANVPDVRPWYERSAVSVVPLRSGGGTRLKILESMAMGVPVISTSIGCEGLDVTDKENILVADSPENFADAVCKLLQNAELRASIAGNARSLVERRYSWDAIAPKLLQVYESLVETQAVAGFSGNPSN